MGPLDIEPIEVLAREQKEGIKRERERVFVTSLSVWLIKRQSRILLLSHLFARK